MVVTTPDRLAISPLLFVADDLARLLERNRHIDVRARFGRRRRLVRSRITKVLPRKRPMIPVEVGFERQVNRRRRAAIEVKFQMPIEWLRRPDAPDATRPFQVGHDYRVTLLANDPIAIPVGAPVDVLIRRRVVLAGAIVARGQRGFFPHRRQHRQMLHIGQMVDQVRIGQRVRL